MHIVKQQTMYSEHIVCDMTSTHVKSISSVEAIVHYLQHITVCTFEHSHH